MVSTVRDLDILHRRHLRGHVEVHHVAGVIAVHEQHPGAAADSARALEDRIGRRRSEDVADGRGVSKATPDKAEERRLMARSAADHEADFATPRAIARHDGTRAADNSAKMSRMGCHYSVEHFIDRIATIVDDLLGLQRHPPISTDRGILAEGIRIASVLVCPCDGLAFTPGPGFAGRDRFITSTSPPGSTAFKVTVLPASLPTARKRLGHFHPPRKRLCEPPWKTTRTSPRRGRRACCPTTSGPRTRCARSSSARSPSPARTGCRASTISTSASAPTGPASSCRPACSPSIRTR